MRRCTVMYSQSRKSGQKILINYSEMIVSRLFIQAEFTNNSLINITGREAFSDYIVS
jgi:hypothetical protein